MIDEAFSGKKKISSLGTALLKHWVIRISESLGVRLKEMCCICVFNLFNTVFARIVSTPAYFAHPNF